LVTQLSPNRISIREDHDAEWEDSRIQRKGQPPARRRIAART
jgi:hypothetical protein